MNIAVGARKGVIDDLFVGDFLGKDWILCLITGGRRRGRLSIFKGITTLLLSSWQPDREDIINIVYQMYAKDGISRNEVMIIVDAFPNQALDFYGALRSRTYDQSISKWVNDIGGYEKLGEKLLKGRKDGKLPMFIPPKQTVEGLVEAGHSLVKEQELILRSKLSKEYMKNMD